MKTLKDIKEKFEESFNKVKESFKRKSKLTEDIQQDTSAINKIYLAGEAINASILKHPKKTTK